MALSQAALARLYLSAFLLGVLWGLCYDAMILLRGCLALPARASTPRSRVTSVLRFLADVLLCLSATVSLILLFYRLNRGSLRPLALLCAPVGLCLYRSTLGRAVQALFAILAERIRKVERWAFRFLTYPARSLLRFLFGVFQRIRKGHQRKRRAHFTKTLTQRTERDLHRVFFQMGEAPSENDQRKERVCQPNPKDNSA